MSSRESRAAKIAADEGSIKQITKNWWKVRSQSGDDWHDVKRIESADVWTCQCKDFQFRLRKDVDKRCMHIIAVQSQREEIEREHEIRPVDRPKICPVCGSSNCRKCGGRKVKNGDRRQRYECRNPKCPRYHLDGSQP